MEEKAVIIGWFQTFYTHLRLALGRPVKRLWYKVRVLFNSLFGNTINAFGHKLIPTWWENEGWDAFKYSYVFALDYDFDEHWFEPVEPNPVDALGGFLLLKHLMTSHLMQITNQELDVFVIQDVENMPVFHFVVATNDSTLMSTLRLTYNYDDWSKYYAGESHNKRFKGLPETSP